MITNEGVKLIYGDCLEVLRGMPDNHVDSIVTDPPYGLSFMGKKWDYDVPEQAIWEECLRVLKPGGHLLAFAGTRTQHRMAVRIEDSGFEIRDMIAWVYGSGFPKSMDVSKAIDKIDAAAAIQWQGRGTALKPALEPITVARKPFKGTVAANVLEWGTGAINIDGGRIGGTVETWPKSRSYAPGQIQPGGKGETQSTGKPPSGRWPANLIHDGSDEPTELLGAAARFFYCAKAGKKDRGEGNTHPTVKPTDLMAYLCRLVTPPGGVVLDPFMGSGSTGKAAVREGFRFIGIEMDESYLEIAESRISHEAGK